MSREDSTRCHLQASTPWKTAPWGGFEGHSSSGHTAVAHHASTLDGRRASLGQDTELGPGPWTGCFQQPISLVPSWGYTGKQEVSLAESCLG